MRKYFVFLWILLIILFLASYVNAQPYLTENQTWQQNLTKVIFSSTIFGDIDNDGDLDLVVIGECDSGCYSTKVYINNGTSLIENQTWEQNLTNLQYGSLAFSDIDNDGDLDLALTGCNSGGEYVTLCNEGGFKTFIYINNGTTFIENQTWQQNLSKVWRSSIAFGDIDNDGDLDMVLTGQTNTNRISKIYINNGTTLVENSTWQSNLTGVDSSSVALGDIDNDGDLDLILSGRDYSYNKITKVYINNGTSLLENSTWEYYLENVIDSSLVLGDYDNDGDLDLSLTGCCDIHRIYRNNGTTFIEIHREIDDLAGVFAGSQSFGDYNNDGYLDLITNGREEYTTLYAYNSFNNNFTNYWQNPESQLMDLMYSSTLLIDLENDGDLDFIETGWGGDGGGWLQAKVYINNITTHNTPPNPPTSFNSNYAKRQLTLTWGSGLDTETNTSGLYYNLRVGTTPNGNNIVSGIHGGGDDNGYLGNMMQRRNITLNVLLNSSQTIYWSVQTIDTGLAKSSWSTEQIYTTSTDTTKPTIVLNIPVNNYNTTNTTIIFNATVYDNFNLTNVSLYGNWGGWHLNETNSSGINNTNYIFTKNLSGYGDGEYAWQINAYDNETNYQLSPVRTFTIDIYYPIINLVSPSSSSTSSSNTVTFMYNVSDIRIINCSLIINEAIDQTNISVTVNSYQSFTKALSNGVYNWNINCTDTVGHTNSSETRALTVNHVTPPSDGSWTSPSTNVNDSNQTNDTLAEENASEISIVSTEENTVITLLSIEAGKTVTAVISKESGVNQISIQVRNAVNNIQIIIKKITSLPPDVAELKGVYKYIAIDKENITDDDISNITITFSINKSWMISNNINESTIILQRYATQWERLITIKTNESDSEISFEAQSTGFSYFAITGESYKLPNQKDDWTVIIVAVIVSACLFAFRMRHKLSRNLKSRVQIPSRALHFGKIP
jgi:PGF-pre-PGF domain-containing protein